MPLEGHSTDQVLVKKKGSRVNFHRHEKDRTSEHSEFHCSASLSVDSQNSEALYLFAVFL